MLSYADFLLKIKENKEIKCEEILSLMSSIMFRKWFCYKKSMYSNFKFREATLIEFVFRDSYKKIETASESLYILKRLSNHSYKLVKSQK